jgi:hypothetical protein
MRPELPTPADHEHAAGLLEAMSSERRVILGAARRRQGTRSRRSRRWTPTGREAERLLMLEPRRVAALCRRGWMAALLGEPLGQRSVSGHDSTGTSAPHTRLESSPKAS